MEKFKSIWDSTGFRGGLTSVISILALMFLSKPLASAGISPEELTQSVLGLVAAVSGVLGIVGRLTAKTQLVTSKKDAETLNGSAGIVTEVPPKVS